MRDSIEPARLPALGWNSRREGVRSEYLLRGECEWRMAEARAEGFARGCEQALHNRSSILYIARLRRRPTLRRLVVLAIGILVVVGYCVSLLTA
jgi:hypothetical protein